MFLKLPITNRIILKIIKSKFFIIFTSLIFFSFIIANICLATLPPKNYITNVLMTQFCVNYALVAIFICGFQMWYVQYFHNADFKLGVFALEIRSGISSKKLILERIILNLILSSVILLIFNIIILISLSLAQVWTLKAMSVSIFIGMFIVFLINIFVYFLLLAFASFKNSLIIGIMGTTIFTLSAMNFIFSILTTMQSKYYISDLGESNAAYKSIASLVELEKNTEYQSELNHLYEDFYLLGVGEHFGSPLSAESMMSSGMALYQYLYDVDDGKDAISNKFIQLLEDLNKSFTKGYNNSNSMWTNSFFDTNSSKTYSLSGTYNFNELINLTSKSENSLLKSLSEIVKQNFQYFISLNTYTKGYDTNESYVYGESNSLWIQKYSKYNLNPGLRIYTISLAYLISNRINVPYFSDGIKNNLISDYNKAVPKINYFNPFIGLQATILYPYVNDKDISSVINAKNDMWFFGIPQVYNVRYNEVESGIREFFLNPKESNFLEISVGKSNFNPIVIFIEYLVFTGILAVIYWLFYRRNVYI